MIAPVTGHAHGTAPRAVGVGSTTAPIATSRATNLRTRRRYEAPDACGVTDVTTDPSSYSYSVIWPRRTPTAFVWIWQTRDSVTPRMTPISASVSPSK